MGMTRGAVTYLMTMPRLDENDLEAHLSGSQGDLELFIFDICGLLHNAFNHGGPTNCHVEVTAGIRYESSYRLSGFGLCIHCA